MSYFWAYEGYQLWQKIYDQRVITDDAVYAENEVPEDYAGPELTIEFAQILVYANEAGQFVEFRQMEYDELKDKDNQIGTGFTYQLYGVEIKKDPPGPSTVKSTWLVKEYPDNLSESARAKASILYRKHLEERGDVPEEN